METQKAKELIERANEAFATIATNLEPSLERIQQLDAERLLLALMDLQNHGVHITIGGERVNPAEFYLRDTKPSS